MRYTVRSTRVLRVSQSISFEVDAESRDEALEMALEKEDDSEAWIEDDRDVLMISSDVQEVQE